MTRRLFLSVAAVLAVVALVAVTSASAAQPSHPDQVFNLPGQSFTPSFNHYSGYIQLPDSPTHLHYWFVESQSDPANDPVVLWLNGGQAARTQRRGVCLREGNEWEDANPTAGAASRRRQGAGAEQRSRREHTQAAHSITDSHSLDHSASFASLAPPTGPGCSSMLGMLTENGPFRLQPDGVTVDLNEDAWNAYASIIYLESPSGVGFSYGTTNNYTSGDDSTSLDNYNFLQGFFAEYSEFATQRFYVTGESYAGNYVLELVQRIIHANAALAPGAIPINIAGLMVGNPTLNWAASANAYLPFMSYHGLVAASDFTKANSICGGVFSPAPNQACADLVAQLTLQFREINPYNIEALCEGEGWGTQPGCFTADALSDAHRPSGLMGPHPTSLSLSSPLSQTFVPCIALAPIRDYLNSAAVMEALHIAVDQVVLPWDACSQVLNYDQINGNMIPVYEDILTNSSMRVLVYSGDVDSCVPYLGTEETVYSFPFAQRTPVKDAWQSWTYVSRAAPTIKQVGGKFQQWGERLAYATVRGAGHMVPHDRPEAAINLFFSFMNDPTQIRFNKI